MCFLGTEVFNSYRFHVFSVCYLYLLLLVMVLGFIYPWFLICIYVTRNGWWAQPASWVTFSRTKIIIFWDITPCSLVDHYPHFGRTYCLQKKPLHCSMVSLYHHECRNLKSLTLSIVLGASCNIVDILFGAYILIHVWGNFEMYQHVSMTLVLSAFQVYLLKQDPNLNLRILIQQVHSGRFMVSFLRCYTFGFIFKNHYRNTFWG
jgi:hypothetical protein